MRKNQEETETYVNSLNENQYANQLSRSTLKTIIQEKTPKLTNLKIIEFNINTCTYKSTRYNTQKQQLEWTTINQNTLIEITKQTNIYNE